jgi:DNA mismatch repair protein MutL
MNRIKQLPPSVITKIAAGEVIERPASVVKELLENAIDAGATRIDVEVEQGGIDLIRVVDNGHGIHVDDLGLAFASHATSKLSAAADLFRIGTLGFRGEALASVGGVGQALLQSRPPSQPRGAEVTCYGGQLSAVRPWNGASGTRIEVRHLFFNTPVRRKFLRSPATEMGHVSETFTRLALSHPALHLTLRHNGKTVYDITGSADDLSGERLRERVGLFFGRDVREKLYAVEAARGPVTLRGFIADPSCDRGHTRMQYLFVNGRFIRDRSLGHAVQEAYRGLVMTGRHAVAFLFLEMPSDEVDVNVHPTKIEVRFQNSQTLHHLVFSTLRDRLNRENLVPQLQPPLLADPIPWALTAPPPPAPPLPFGAGKMSPVSTTPPSVPGTEHSVLSTPFTVPDAETSEPAAQQPPSAPANPPPTWPRAAGLPQDHSRILQVHDTYLVVETGEGMLVIDQHALHERILFEQLKERLRSGPLESQRLLIPEPVELSAEQAARTLEHRQELLELGLEVEDFGGGTLLLTSYPALLSRRGPAEILRAVVDHLMSQDRLPTREVLLNDLLSLMACHAAVRAGDRLSAEQMAALVEQRHLAQDTHHCPHGRPTALLFSRQELDRQFRRV